MKFLVAAWTKRIKPENKLLQLLFLRTIHPTAVFTFAIWPVYKTTTTIETSSCNLGKVPISTSFKSLFDARSSEPNKASGDNNPEQIQSHESQGAAEPSQPVQADSCSVCLQPATGRETCRQRVGPSCTRSGSNHLPRPRLCKH